VTSFGSSCSGTDAATALCGIAEILEDRGLGASGHHPFAEGQRGGDHERYTLTLADGDVLYTRISNGRGQYDDDAALITMILRVQFRVTEADFWACVERGVLPPRLAPEQPRGRARNWMLRSSGTSSAGSGSPPTRSQA